MEIITDAIHRVATWISSQLALGHMVCPWQDGVNESYQEGTTHFSRCVTNGFKPERCWQSCGIVTRGKLHHSQRAGRTAVAKGNASDVQRGSLNLIFNVSDPEWQHKEHMESTNHITF